MINCKLLLLTCTWCRFFLYQQVQ